MKRFKETKTDFLVKYKNGLDGLSKESWVSFSKDQFTLVEVMEALAETISSLDSKNAKQFKLLKSLARRLADYN